MLVVLHLPLNLKICWKYRTYPWPLFICWKYLPLNLMNCGKYSYHWTLWSVESTYHRTLIYAKYLSLNLVELYREVELYWSVGSTYPWPLWSVGSTNLRTLWSVESTYPSWTLWSVGSSCYWTFWSVWGTYLEPFWSVGNTLNFIELLNFIDLWEVSTPEPYDMLEVMLLMYLPHLMICCKYCTYTWTLRFVGNTVPTPDPYWSVGSTYPWTLLVCVKDILVRS